MSDDTKSRLIRFFSKYNPVHVANVDKILAQFAGKEDALWQTLVRKYGPEPSADASLDAPKPEPVPASPASGDVGDTRARLTRFFTKYNPGNLGNVDKIMAQFAGKEDALWQQLTAKYGPEPPVVVNAAVEMAPSFD